MTRIMAREMRGRNITANAVAPGPTATKLFLDGKPQQVIDQATKAPPLERLAQPKDIANRKRTKFRSRSFDAVTQAGPRQANHFVAFGDQDTADRQQRIEMAYCRSRSN